jgi:hypothetical protein
MTRIAIADLAEVAEQAYSDPASIERGEFHAVYAEISGITIVGIRGTNSPGDLLVDGDIIPKYRLDLDCYFHGGFLGDVEGVEHELNAFLNGKNWIAVGHSKGGSEALIAASLVGTPPLAVVAFGPARPAFSKFRGVLERCVPSILLLRHGADPIPDSPWGFQQPGDLFVFGTPTASINKLDDHYLAAYRAALSVLPESLQSISV